MGKKENQSVEHNSLSSSSSIPVVHESLKISEDEIYQFIPLSNIRESKTNPRKHFDEKELNDLVNSVKEKGVIQPIVVRSLTIPAKGELPVFEIVVGERRFKASKLAKLEKIPAVIREYSDTEVIEIQSIENVQRSNVHPLDEAEGYRKLIDVCKYDVPSISVKVGKSPAYVYQRIQMVQLTDEWKKHFYDGVITPAHALLICRLQPAAQKKCLGDYRVITQPYGTNKWVVEPVHAVREFIEKNFHLDLSKTNFNKKDPNLIPGVPACTECPKRSGFNKELFNDISKDDICTDPKCFNKKIQQHLVQVINASADPTKPEIVKITDDYWTRGNKKDILTKNQYDVAKKSDKGAVKAVVAEGTHAGAVKYIKLHSNKSSASSSSSLTPAQKAKFEKAKREAELKQLTDKKIRNEIIKAAKPGIKNFDTLHLTKIAEVFLEEGDVNDEELGAILGIESITHLQMIEDRTFDFEKHFKKLKASELIKLIVLMIYVSNYEYHSNKKLATGLGVNYKSIEKKVQAEMKKESEPKEEPKDKKKTTKKK